MFRIQATYTSLRKATMWLGFAVSGGWLGSSPLGCLDGEDYFNLEIKIDRDNRPNHNNDRPQIGEALTRNLSGRYSNQRTVPR